MKSLPIRVRLSLWYFAMFASAACFLCMMSWWMLHRSVDAAEYHEMQERAEDVQILLEHQGANRSLDELRQEFISIYTLKDDGKWLQVRDQDGNWIYRSKRMIAENPDLPPPDRLPKDGIIAQFHQGTRLVRILAYPVSAQGRLYSVQTGVALNKSMALLATFRTNLLLLAPAVILLAGFGGHLMSRKVLEPVAALTTEARRINDRNLDTRLPVPCAEDELSDLAKTLNQMLERIDKAFRSVRAFTGNASHELRTPISLLRTEIEIALYRPRPAEEYRATLLRLHEETIRMTNLVENLLSLARADGGAEIATLMPITVNDLLKQAERGWRSLVEGAMLEFWVEKCEMGVAILGDATGIDRVLSILIENAIKYTAPGGAVILSATSAEECVVFKVQDTGVGIAAEDQAKIFERFYRVAQTNGAAPRGSGLGLAIAKWIVERHGAQLKVDSEPGRGSCFSFVVKQAIDATTTRRALSGLPV